MSDSDDNVPISALKNTSSATKRRHEDSSDDDVPIQQLAKKRAGNGSSNKAELGAADSDDDLSLAALKKKAASKAKAAPLARGKLASSKGAPKPASKGAKRTTPPKKSPKSKTQASSRAKSSGGSKRGASAKKTTKKPRSRDHDQGGGDKLVTRSSVLQETKKGELVQKLLCRWWYAMEWPAKQDVIPAPANYVALEGYPGVYVCVEGDDIGKLLDVRNKDTCPCYTNFSNKSSEELKELLERALVNQKEALIRHWGEGVEEEANIDRELKWLRTVDPSKADRTAARALSHAKLDF